MKLTNLFQRLFFLYWGESKYGRTWFLSFKVPIFMSIIKKRLYNVRLPSRLVPQVSGYNH